MAIKRTIPHGSDHLPWNGNNSNYWEFLQTLHKDKNTPFFPTLQTYLRSGIQENNKQYFHTAYYDS
jgi:hypothetical protein